MNLDTFRPKNETEYLLLSTAKNCETLFDQTHTRPQDTLEFKLTQPREIFSFQPPIPIERSWMIGFTSLEVCNYISNTTEEKKQNRYL